MRPVCESCRRPLTLQELEAISRAGNRAPDLACRCGAAPMMLALPRPWERAFYLRGTAASE